MTGLYRQMSVIRGTNVRLEGVTYNSGTVGIEQIRSTVLKSLPLLWLSLAFIAGIVLAAFVALSWWTWALLTLAAAAGAIVFRRRFSWLAAFTLLAAMTFFLGGLRYQAAQPTFTPDDIAYFNDASDVVEVLGVVDTPPVHRDSYLEIRVRAESLIANAETIRVRGLLLGRLPLGSELQYGDRIRIFGQLVTPEEDQDFSYRDYLARDGIYSLMPFASVVRVASGQGDPLWSAFYDLRQRGLDVISNLFPPQEAGLLSGILLGDESRISEPLKAAFNDTGARHIIAISGFNITIIAGVFLSLTRRWLGVHRGIWLAGLGVAFYTILVGADAAVVRAAIMGIVALLALRTGRQPFAFNTLAITAALMALFNPLVLWDVGFQLSFAATLGLVLFSGPIRKRADAWLVGRLPPALAARLSGPLADYVYMTVAAQITTLPLLLFYFQRLSLLSLPVNLLILPVQPAVMILGGLSVLAGLLVQPLGQLVAFVAVWPVTYTIRVVEFFARLPIASTGVVDFPFAAILIYYCALAIICLPRLRQRLGKLRVQPALGLGLLAALTLWVWSSALAAPDGMLHIIALDVKGEAILVRTPEGHNLLINAGPSRNALVAELQRELPYGQTLDWLLVTGRQQDQIGALADGLQSLSPAALAWAAAGDRVADLAANAGSLGIPVTELQTSDHFALGDGAKLTVVARGPRGAVLLLEWLEFGALLPLGLDFDLMEAVDWESIDPVDLYLLADGGYPPLNSPDWVLNFSPSMIWAASNEVPVIDGLSVVSTPSHGWLRLTTDGQQMWLESGQ